MPIVMLLSCYTSLLHAFNYFSFCQYCSVGMDGHRQQLGSQHVEYESRTWMHAFNIGISISTMYDLVVR
jgi:hypothetical protein